MNVILLSNLKRLGGFGETVDVKPGYARNYLIPNGSAVYATKANRAEFARMRDEIEAKNREKNEQYVLIAQKLKGIVPVIIKQAGEDGKLFGSVTVRDVINAIKPCAPEIEKKFIRIMSIIRYVGIYNVMIDFSAEISVEIQINVARSESDAKVAYDEYLKEKKVKKLHDLEVNSGFLRQEESGDDTEGGTENNNDTEEEGDQGSDDQDDHANVD